MKVAMKAISVFFAFMLLAGCGAGEPAKKHTTGDSQSKGKQQAWVDTDLAGKVKNTAQSVNGVRDTTAVVINKDISVAVKVSGLDRLRLKKIKSEVHEKVSGVAGGYEVHVTTDKKLFSELRKIDEQTKGEKPFQPAEFKEKVEKINNDMGG